MMQIYHALPGDAEKITEIAIAAKRHWGYPERWIEIWTPLPTFMRGDIRNSIVFKALVNEEIAGFYRLFIRESRATQEDLWVMPNFMGYGIGKALFEHAISGCRSANVTIKELEANPNAHGFYEKMGMHKVGEKRTEVDGQPRTLPIMEISL